MSKKKYRRQSGSTGVASHPAPAAEPQALEVSDPDAEISIEEARRMLSGAARMLDASVKLARKALANVTAEQLQKLAEDEISEPQPADQRKRARGSRPAVLVLLTTGASIARLLKQTLKVLHPELFGAKPPKKETWLDAAAKASMAEKLGKQLAAIRA
ncbi:MAG: hypothetical protein KDB82_07255 [Planctomycetes bacterium]|nr:hypothetical protein [Planctomycetota bacterium]